MNKTRLKLFLTGLVFSALCTIAPRPTLAQRAIPADNLAYPVLIDIPAVDSGSGFYLSTATSVYLVTAKHVLFNPSTGKLLGPKMTLLSYPPDPNDPGVNLISVDLTTLSSSGDVIPSPTEDVVAIRIEDFLAAQPANSQIKNAQGKSVPGVTAIKLASSGLLLTSVDIVKKYPDVLVGNDIVVYGYPTSIGLKQIPQIDLQRPLLRQGIVAGLNPATRTIVIDCLLYPGNSGGPVIEVDRTAFQSQFKLIGVVIQYVPFARGSSSLYSLDNSGYAIAAPMDGVLALVK